MNRATIGAGKHGESSGSRRAFSLTGAARSSVAPALSADGQWELPCPRASLPNAGSVTGGGQLNGATLSDARAHAGPPTIAVGRRGTGGWQATEPLTRAPLV